MDTPNFTILEQILGIPNTKITKIRQSETEIHIHLECTNQSAVCPICNCECDTVHEQKEKREIRDCSVFGKKCFLHFIHRRFKCSKCIKSFIKTYNTFEDCILNYFDKRQSNGLLEGMNNNSMDF